MSEPHDTPESVRALADCCETEAYEQPHDPNRLEMLAWAHALYRYADRLVASAQQMADAKARAEAAEEGERLWKAEAEARGEAVIGLKLDLAHALHLASPESDGEVSAEAAERLARRLHTREPYKHPMQIVAEIPVRLYEDAEPHPMGGIVVVLGQGDYPTFGQMADETRRLQDEAAAMIRSLSAEVERIRQDREFVIGWNDGFEEGLRQAEEVVRESAADQNASAGRWAEAIAKAEHEWAARLIGYAADAIAALSPQDPAREQEAEHG